MLSFERRVTHLLKRVSSTDSSFFESVGVIKGPVLLLNECIESKEWNYSSITCDHIPLLKVILMYLIQVYLKWPNESF